MATYIYLRIMVVPSGGVTTRVGNVFSLPRNASVSLYAIIRHISRFMLKARIGWRWMCDAIFSVKRGAQHQIYFSWASVLSFMLTSFLWLHCQYCSLFVHFLGSEGYETQWRSDSKMGRLEVCNFTKITLANSATKWERHRGKISVFFCLFVLRADKTRYAQSVQPGWYGLV